LTWNITGFSGNKLFFRVISIAGIKEPSNELDAGINSIAADSKKICKEILL
jgi:hypothetical protein